MDNTWTITVDDALVVLNRILAADPAAVAALVDERVACNEELAGDPTVQVLRGTDGDYRVGILGIINGLFGIFPSDHPKAGWGPITLECDDKTGIPLRFTRTE